jgi:hypothetical protein
MCLRCLLIVCLALASGCPTDVCALWDDGLALHGHHIAILRGGDLDSGGKDTCSRDRDLERMGVELVRAQCITEGPAEDRIRVAVQPKGAFSVSGLSVRIDPDCNVMNAVGLLTEYGRSLLRQREGWLRYRCSALPFPRS